MGCYHSKASEPKAVAGSGNASAAPTLLEVRDLEVGKHTKDLLGDAPEKTLFTTPTSASGNYDSWIKVRVSTLPEEGAPAQSNDLKCMVDSGNNCICFIDKDMFGLKQGADGIWTAARPYIVMHQNSLDAWSRDAVIVKGPLSYGGGDDTDPERLGVVKVEAEFYVTKEVPHTHRENNFGIAPYHTPADSKYPERPKSALYFTNYRYASIQLVPKGSGAMSKLQLGNSDSLMAGCTWFDASHFYKGGNSLIVKSFKFDHDGSGWDVDKSWSAEEGFNAEMDTGGGPIIVDNKTGLFLGAVSNATPIGWDAGSKTDVFLNGIIEIELWDKVSPQTFKYRLEKLPKQPSQQLPPCMIVVRPPDTLNCRGVNLGGLSFLYIDMIMDLEQKRLGLRQKP